MCRLAYMGRYPDLASHDVELESFAVHIQSILMYASAACIYRNICTKQAVKHGDAAHTWNACALLVFHAFTRKRQSNPQQMYFHRE
jgi:hypothetical protein